MSERRGLMSTSANESGLTIDITSDNSSFCNMWIDFDSAGVKTVNIIMDYWNNRSIPTYIANSNVETINVIYENGYKPSSMRDFCRGEFPYRRGGVQAHKLRTINLIDVDTSGISDWFASFNAKVNNVTINGELNFSSYASGNPFNGGNGFVDIRFAPNTLSVGMTVSASQIDTWSDATLVSFANCLAVGTATLTVGSAPQTRMSQLMGDVDGGLFVADASGTTNLLDFITTVKGWTLA